MLKPDADYSRRVLDKATPGGRRYASYVTAIELNKGFILTAITFYLLIKDLRDVSAAMMQMSNGWGRSPKYILIIEAYIKRSVAWQSSDYRIYLAALEDILNDLILRWKNLVKKFMGSCAACDLSQLEPCLIGDEFVALQKSYKNQKVDFAGALLSNHKVKLLKMQQELKSTEKKNKVLEDLSAAIDSILKSEATRYKNLADLLIFLDMPKDHTLIAKDRFFETLTAIRRSRFTYLDFKKP